VRTAAVSVFAGLALLAAGPASASQLVTRGVGHAGLEVNRKGEALITYHQNRRMQHVLTWGAINARPPASGRAQVRFKLDYSGGWHTYRTNYWQTFRNACRRYTGPPLAFFVTACNAPDGSHWALQSWQVQLPDLGITPWLPQQRAWELHVSHWTGPLPKLEAWTDWVYSARFHQVFGRYSYAGSPVYGFGTTRYGAPTDGYGRLIFLDTYNSRYGPGWRRENSFVAHNPTGVWCYGFYQYDASKYPHPKGVKGTIPRGPGNGQKYRLSANGPGAAPDVSIVVPGLHDFNPGSQADVDFERQQNAVLDSIIGPDKLCRAH